MPSLQIKNFLSIILLHVFVYKSLSVLGLECNELSKLVLEMFKCMGNICSYSVMPLSIGGYSIKLGISSR